MTHTETAKASAAFVADYAAAVKAEVAPMIELIGSSASYGRREAGIRVWMLESVTVTHNADSVTVTFGRGSGGLADTLAANLIDRASTPENYTLGCIHRLPRGAVIQF